MANTYKVLKEKHQAEVNAFPMMFAFSNQQFEDGMKKLGLEVGETDKIYSIGAGGFIRKTDSQALCEMMENHKREMKEAIEEDVNGDGFIFDMFNYELANHEYCITYDVEDTLDALGMTIEEVNADERLKLGLARAKRAQLKD